MGGEGFLAQIMVKWKILRIGWMARIVQIFFLDAKEAYKLKNVTKSGKSPQFSRPPPPGFFVFFEFGEKWKFDDPPPCT